MRKPDYNADCHARQWKAKSMILMTLNLRFQNEHDGQNGWENRKDLILELVRVHKPAFLGTQEGTVTQLRFLQEHLSGYELFAPERLWEDDCQYCSIFMRSEAVRALEGGEFWLSETPAVHRSIGWDSAFPRMMSHGLFTDLESARTILLAVTHLDNIGVEARKQQARIIRDWLALHNGPRVLMGDFNDRPGSAAHQLLTSPESGLFDTWQVLRRPEDESSMTYHKFLGVPMVCRMDWILASGEFRVEDARVVYDHSEEGRYPSDHFPYMVRLAWA